MASKTLVTTWDQDQGGSAPDGHRNVQNVITEPSTTSGSLDSPLTLTVDWDPNIKIQVVEEDGALVFTLKVTKGVGDVRLGDLQGIFFDLDETYLQRLGASVADETFKVSGSEDLFFDVDKDNALNIQLGKQSFNVQGESANDSSVGPNRPYDIAVRFGTNGAGADFITDATFILSANATPLTLDLIDGEAFALRLTSVGEKGDSLKLTGTFVDDGSDDGDYGGGHEDDEDDDTGDGGNGDDDGTGGDDEDGGKTPLGDYDDLIEAGSGNDTIYGGRGNDEMQGEGGDDIIVGGTDDGRLEFDGEILKRVTIGDNLYGNDGADTYFYAKGDGVDLIWDFRPDEDTVVLEYSLAEIVGVTYVPGVTNRIDTTPHDKISLILGRGEDVHDAIIINDFGGLRDSTRPAFVFADGQTLSMQGLLALAKPATGLPLTSEWAPPSALTQHERAASSLDLYGGNGAELLVGRSGDDRLYGNEGFNKLNGNDGPDELYGGNQKDVMLGGSGRDIGYGNGGDDTIVGGVGSDKLYGAGGADIIYGDTDGVEDGKDISYPGFDFRFHLGLEEKYRALFESADPVDGISVRPGDLVITPGKNWWGGFEVTVTVKAEASLANWSLFLNSAYEITSIWGAELSRVTDGKTSDVYELKNALWNGRLTKGETTTIGFTVRTPFDRVVDEKKELLKGLKIGTEATLDHGVASAIADINQYLNSKKAVTVSESYTLTGSTQKLAAVSGSKAIDLTGNKLGNTIVGNDGSNEIAGRAGKDVLTGKKGKDAFVFDSALSKSNVDIVTDFSVKDDKFYLDNSVFKKLGSGAPSKPKQLKKNFFSLDKAKDKNDHLIYSEKTGVLSYDADGSGKGQAIKFAKVKAGLDLKYNDLFII